MSGLQETFAGRVEFIVLNIDDNTLDDIRRQLGITAQAQYIVVNSADEIVARWFGIIDQSQLTAELENLLQS